MSFTESSMSRDVFRASDCTGNVASMPPRHVGALRQGPGELPTPRLISGSRQAGIRRFTEAWRNSKGDDQGGPQGGLQGGPKERVLSALRSVPWVMRVIKRTEKTFEKKILDIEISCYIAVLLALSNNHYFQRSTRINRKMDISISSSQETIINMNHR